MVGTNPIPVAAEPAVAVILARLMERTHRFVVMNDERLLQFSVDALAVVVAEIVAEATAALHADVLALGEQHQRTAQAAVQLRAGVSAVLGYGFPDGYPGDERAVADLRELAGEARTRENEVISLGYEVEKLERALSEAARDSHTAARFVDTMIGGDR